MATAAAAAPAAAPADAAPAPKKSKKLLIIILAVVVLLAGGGGAAAFFLMKKKAGDSPAKEHKAAERKGPSVFATLDPFTVNLADPSREHYLQVGLIYELYSADVENDLKAQMPLLRSRALLLLTSKTSVELITAEGKGKLAGELVTLARAALAASKSPGAQNSERGVADVHFSSFIIQ
jgi:flagellar FliL protein